jgi:HEAT repeat protein
VRDAVAHLNAAGGRYSIIGPFIATTAGVLVAACLLALVCRRGRRCRVDPTRAAEQVQRPQQRGALDAAAPVALDDALDLTPGAAAISPLSAIVRSGTRHERTEACRALARIGQPEVVPLLVEALADDAWEVRAEAARGLTGIGGGSCVPELERALADGAWWVRANAAGALRSIDPEGIAALERAAGSADPTAASHARDALADDARDLAA